MATETGVEGVSATREGPAAARKEAARPRLDALRKGMVGVAAILVLGSAVCGRLEYLAESREHARVAAEALATSRTQQGVEDYPAAWASLQAATQGARSGGLLVKWLGGSATQQGPLLTAEQDLAMEWLRKAPAKVGEGHSYSEITDPVLGVLTGAVEHAAAARRADLLAHIGWAYALKQDDGVAGLHPEQLYRQALALDPDNPYANTFLGYPVVAESAGSEAGVAQLKQRFGAALASGRATGPVRQWVREQELASMSRWLGSDAVEAFFWQTVNEMHKGGEPLSEQALGDMRSEYLGNEIGVDAFAANLSKLQAFVPAADHVGLLRMLLATSDDQWKGYLKVTLAIALERSDKPGDSLTAFRDARADLAGNPLVSQLDASIARLAGAGGPAGTQR